MRYDYVEIGTSYFDTLIQDPSAGTGLSIEPIREYLDMLPNREGCVKVNAAITDKDGEVDVYLVEKNDVTSHSLPEWVCGCNSVCQPHPTVLKLLSEKNLEHLMRIRKVQAICVETLFEKYNIQSVDTLKIDVEGKDGHILAGWFETSTKRNVPLPKTIIIESNGLDQDGMTSRAIEAAVSLGYDATRKADDVILSLTRNKKRHLKILFFVEADWAFGSIHYEIGKFAHARGHTFDIVDWKKSYSLEAFKLLVDYYDFIVTTPTPNEISILVNDYRVPYEKIVLIGHSELDFRRLSAANRLDELNKVAGVAVVSESLCSSVVSSVDTNIIPAVLQLGVNYRKFYTSPSSELRVVGYAATNESYTPSGVEFKRGHLLETCTNQAGLKGHAAKNISWIAMPTYYKQIDALICSSLFEGAGLPSLEAAAAGRLVISTPVGHFPVNSSMGCGIIAPLEKRKFVEFTSRTLKYYADNPTAYREKCLSMQEAASNLDWSIRIEDWIEFFESLV